MVWYKISIHAVLADCDYDVYNRCTQIDISIHAVLADCDQGPSGTYTADVISIHAVLADCDWCRFIRRKIR